jgi:hypothetical protein
MIFKPKWQSVLAVLLLTVAPLTAYAQGPQPPTIPVAKPAAKPVAAPAPKPAAAAPTPATEAPPPDISAPDVGATSQPLTPTGPMVLLLRGLDKITGRPTNIVAPIGKPVQFATLTITARYCYSTPPSETPETAAFVQIDDHRPDQSPRHVFSGWMYASSPGLNGMQHPLYDVWAISCNTNQPGNAPPQAMASTAPVKVAAPDSTDKEAPQALPAEAGK